MRILRTPVVALAGLALLACSPGNNEIRSVGTDHPAGLVLTVALGPDDPEIVRIEPTDSPAVHPTLQGEIEQRVFLVGFYDISGKPLTVYDWPGDGIEIYHHHHPEAPVDTHTKHDDQSHRTVEVPVPDNASFLMLAVAAPSADEGQTVVCDRSCISCQWREPEGDGRHVFETLAVFPLAFDLSGNLQERLFEPPAAGLPRVTVKPVCVLNPVMMNRPFASACPFDDGRILGKQLLWGTDTLRTDKFYDIVVLGDGFTEEEMPKLQQWATRLQEGLVETPPYESLSEHINIWLVKTASPQSGVMKCSGNEGEHRTFFEVEGQWTDPVNGTGPDGFFGTRAHCRIWEAASEVAPLGEIELIVMLVNCNTYGGKAEPWARLVYVPTYEDNPSTFLRLALHEMGHTVGWLGEEYIACAKPHPHYRYPAYFSNVVPAALAADAWWKGLLEDEEKTESGGFLAKHDITDGFEADNCTPRMPPGASSDMLGLYWGSMYGEAKNVDANQCHVFCGWDNEGHDTGEAFSDYYRPAKTCLMRSIKQPYCRACSERLCQEIRRVDPLNIWCELDHEGYDPFEDDR